MSMLKLNKTRSIKTDIIIEIELFEADESSATDKPFYQIILSKPIRGCLPCYMEKCDGIDIVADWRSKDISKFNIFVYETKTDEEFLNVATYLSSHHD